MIDATLPFISQLRQLVQPAELRGLTADLSVTVPALAKLTVASIPLFKHGVRPASSCVANVIYPWSQLTINDSHFNASNGFPPHKAYVEAVDYLPGLAGETRDFDANGPYIRVLGALGNTVTQSLSDGLVGGALQQITGTEPSLPPGGKRPPLEPKVPCETQAPITTLDTTASQGPAPITIPTLSPLVRQRAAKAHTKLIDMLHSDLTKAGIHYKYGPGAAGTATSTKKSSGN